MQCGQSIGRRAAPGLFSQLDADRTVFTRQPVDLHGLDGQHVEITHGHCGIYRKSIGMADFQPRFDRRGLAAEDHQGYPVGVYIPDDNPLVGIVTCHCPGVGMDFERTQEQPVDKLEDAARDTYPVEHIDGFRRQPSPQLLGHLEHGHITAGSTYRIILVAQGIGRNVLGHRAPCPRGFVIDAVRPGIPRDIAQQVGAGALFPVALGKKFQQPHLFAPGGVGKFHAEVWE